MDTEKIVIDGTGHIAGKLAAKVAKQLLEGKSVVVLRAEAIELTGPIERLRLRYKEYLNKRCLVNPRKGPYHYSEPSKLFHRVVKRMVPHKKFKGASALKRLTVYDGIPKEYEGVPRMKCPKTLLKACANPVRKHASYGVLCKEFGWKHFELAKAQREALEAKEEREMTERKERERKLKEVRESSGFKKEVENIFNRIE
ncbi:60S ribosomal protein L13a [Astathelohania contejeani]|uniref:60S ribosomal protein L13a n=1 Tax=Astathelohania contejeani TaxID=164912 RepID=A0ABQ7I0K7_9MICR|nr:60S ribosomal protein L13a [Thelohania contejeani]